MHAAFGTVVVVVCVVGLVAAVAALATGGRTWAEYGKDLLLMDRDAGSASSAAAVAERDAEIRQMLEARNARLRRRGEQTIDVERELTRLTAPEIDEGLRAEIRDLVIARNHRRVRAGKPPLDVEAEIERQIADLRSL